MLKSRIVLLMCLLFATSCGIESTPKTIVPVPTEPRGKAHHISGLTLYDDTLYFGAGHCLYGLETQSQTLSEIRCVADWAFQRPATDGKRAYVQSVASLAAYRSLTAIDLSTGETSWQIDEPPGTGRKPAAREYTVLLDDRIVSIQGEQHVNEHRICAFDTRSGQQLWCTKPHITSSFVPFFVQGDQIWYNYRVENTTRDGILIAVNQDSGRIQQTIDLLPDVRFEQMLYVDDEWVFGFPQGSSGKFVSAVHREQPDKEAWRSSSLPLSNLDSDQALIYKNLFLVALGKGVYALSIETGQTKWVFAADAEAPAIPRSEDVVLFVLSEESHRTLYALEPSTGVMVWQYALASYDTNEFGYMPVSIQPRPLVDSDIAYIANATSIDALDLHTGKQLWQVQVKSAYEYHLGSP